MKKNSSHNKFFSLVEIFAAITLMLIVSAVFVTNVKSSFEKGKAFKSREGARQIYRGLMLHSAEFNKPIEEVAESWEECIADSPLIGTKNKNNDPLKDGWGQPYVVSVTDLGLEVRSTALEQYNSQNSSGGSFDQNEDTYWE